ncbi:hypothetical protein [Tenacibaculum sp. SDUM215027]|uniref:hypothetical protein n=1 Tax=Tenacibaculum sp. SDUM215027 TaxID=3422596 RepID=UPI003D322090
MKQHKIDLLISFFLYGVGLLSLLVSDLYISKNFDDFFIADWAFIKSSILIISTVCLMGYDTLFIRDQSLIKRYFKRFWGQTIIIAFLVSIIIWLVKGFSINQVIMLFFAIVGLAFLNYISSSSRACYNLWKAQFSINFWKIILLLLLLLSYFDQPINYYVVSVLIGGVLSFFLRGYYPKERNIQDKDSLLSLRDANKMGAYFLLTNLTLVFAVNGEQFVINLYGDANVSAHLFTYFSVFTPIALSINGFLGFYFGPKVRRQKEFNLKHYFNFSKKILVFSILITIFSVIAGYFYMIKFMNVAKVEIDWALISVLAFLCIVRGIYISTSIGLGIFGSKRSIGKSALMFWVFTIVYIFSIFIMLAYLENEFVVLGIATASLLNWIGRFSVSNYFTIKELKTINENV